VSAAIALAAHSEALLLPADVLAGVSVLLDEAQGVSPAILRALGPEFNWLKERAQLLGFTSRGARSCNGSAQMLEVRDGWIVANLPRASDLELLPAWLGIAPNGDLWPTIGKAVRRRDVAELIANATELGLAVAPVLLPGDRLAPLSTQPAPAVIPKRSAATAIVAPQKISTTPLVLDLSALWAGPLCGQLLRASGARVIKVESSSRPDATRTASPAFHERLNAGKEPKTLDFNSAAGRTELQTLLERADIVVTSARPRALQQLGIAPEALLAAQPEKIWAAITAYGWEGAAGQRIGFGDDTAAAAGLVALARDGQPGFIGDAIADPLAGLAAANAALNAWQQLRGGLLDISLAQSAARVVAQLTQAPGSGP
jgi:hypothetical protein